MAKSAKIMLKLWNWKNTSLTVNVEAKLIAKRISKYYKNGLKQELNL